MLKVMMLALRAYESGKLVLIDHDSKGGSCSSCQPNTIPVVMAVLVIVG